MKRSFAAVLCVIMLLCVVLAGCQTKDPLLGTWKGKVDLTEMLNEQIAGADAGMAEYFVFEDLYLEVTMTFNEDKTCAMVINDGSLDTLLDTLTNQMMGGMTKMIEELLAGYGMDMTVDEYMAMLGTDMETLIKESMSASITEETFESLETAGTYKTEDGKLYITDDEDGEFDEDDATAYTLEGNTLTIEAPEDVDEEMAKALFPMVLTKVEEAE